MIAIDNLSFKYSDQYIIKDLSVTFPSKEISCILGSSGCGKSTLLNLICGLLSPNEGTITSDSKNFSYVFQSHNLIPWMTVWENMHLILKQFVSSKDLDNLITEYLSMVELLDYKNMFPRELSGGMKQRLSLARAFAFPSEHLLMDEPFTSLNHSLKSSLHDLFLNLWSVNKKTVAFVSHDIDEAILLAQNIYVVASEPLSAFHKFNVPSDETSRAELKSELIKYI